MIQVLHLRVRWMQQCRDRHRVWAAGLAVEVTEIATAKLAADLAAEPAAGLIERSNSAKLTVVLSSA